MNNDTILREKLALQRTILANQSTFLSFLRTSLYFSIAGLSLNDLLKINNSFVIDCLFFVISGIILTFGLVNYFIQRSIIIKSEKYIASNVADYLDEI